MKPGRSSGRTIVAGTSFTPTSHILESNLAHLFFTLVDAAVSSGC
jgi:hypothetical protein